MREYSINIPGYKLDRLFESEGHSSSSSCSSLRAIDEFYGMRKKRKSVHKKTKARNKG